MKPISQKVIEAGLVPKHALLLFKRWGYLDPEDTDLPEEGPEAAKGDQLKEGFIQFVEELDTLLEAKAEEEIKETRFSITLKDPRSVKWLREDKHGNFVDMGDWTLVVFSDEVGRLIFPPSENPAHCRFRIIATKERMEVTSCTPLWHGDTLYAYQVEAEPF